MSLFFLAIFFTGILFAQGQVSITGTITKPAGKNITFYYYKNLLANQPVFYQADLEEDGSFSVNFELEKPIPITMRHGRETTAMYVYPGDLISLSLNPKNFDETIKYEGQGKGVAASNFLAAQFLEFENALISDSEENIMKTMKAEEFLVAMDNLQQRKQDFLAKYMKENGLSKDFAEYYRSSESYKWANDLMNYKPYHAFYNKIEEEEVEIPDGYYSFLTKMEITNNKAITWSEYVSFVKNYLDYKTSNTTDGLSDEGEVTAMDKYNLAQKYLFDEPRILITAMIIKDALEYGNPLEIEDAYSAFVSTYAKTEYATLLKPIFKEAMRLAPGQPAPDIQLVDINGENVELRDFRGKVVYLDFWASWCGPCRAQMPYAKELKEEYKGQDVVFLYVSIDDDEEAWRKAVEEENLKGVLLFSQGFRSETPQAYGVKAIPNYFLINRNGTIALSNPDRPSGKNVRKQINEALESRSR
ncbi:MAG: TlpA family protein disulfide reductase [Bacteroidetes bacterium]|nr:TlpA family protein disulfide reductase [Bacteroidota bacterium]